MKRNTNDPFRLLCVYADKFAPYDSELVSARYGVISGGWLLGSETMCSLHPFKDGEAWPSDQFVALSSAITHGWSMTWIPLRWSSAIMVAEQLGNPADRRIEGERRPTPPTPPRISAVRS